MFDVGPILGVIFFWALAFLFAFWFCMRALRAPIEYEGETGEVAVPHDNTVTATP